MSKIKPGQIGEFSGKIGQVVVSKWKSLTVGRSVPRKSGKKITEAQAIQRSKFGLITNFISKFAAIIDVGFPLLKGNQSPRNMATSLNLKNAIIGLFPDFKIDFEKVILAAGKLNGVFNPVAASVPDSATISVNWTLNEVDQNGTSPDDNVAVMVYNPDLDAAQTNQFLAKREDLTATIRLPYAYAGHEVHVWMVLISVDGKSASGSTYLGKHLVID